MSITTNSAGLYLLTLHNVIVYCIGTHCLYNAFCIPIKNCYYHCKDQFPLYYCSESSKYYSSQSSTASFSSSPKESITAAYNRPPPTAAVGYSTSDAPPGFAASNPAVSAAPSAKANTMQSQGAWQGFDYGGAHAAQQPQPPAQVSQPVYQSQVQVAPHQRGFGAGYPAGGPGYPGRANGPRPLMSIPVGSSAPPSSRGGQAKKLPQQPSRQPSQSGYNQGSFQGDQWYQGDQGSFYQQGGYPQGNQTMAGYPQQQQVNLTYQNPSTGQIYQNSQGPFNAAPQQNMMASQGGYQQQTFPNFQGPRYPNSSQGLLGSAPNQMVYQPPQNTWN